MVDSVNEAIKGCLLCQTEVNVSSKRRIIHPSSKSNAEVHNFVVEGLCRGWSLPANDTVIYTCRAPCFAELVKAAKLKKHWQR